MKHIPMLQSFRQMQSAVPRITRVVTIDAMNTLVAPKEPPTKTYCDFAEKKGMPCDRAKMDAAFPKAMHDMSLKHPCFGHKGIGALNWWSEVVVTSLKKAVAAKFDEKVAHETANELFEFFASSEAWRILDPEASSFFS